MAHSVSARKRVRQNEKARAKNKWRMRTLKDSLKSLEDKLLHGAPDTELQKLYRESCAILDRTAQKGVIHKNTAARKKSRLAARIKGRKAGPSKA
ncbi:MAG TPA: 30S ribosomal protein S20 [Phycisphaerales bacterium]|nr:30S ribosomal protein S20 [Phycisphaerales bacterium]